MIGSPATSVYSDVTLGEYLQRFPLIDALGRSPFRSTAAGVELEVNPFWTEAYDANAAASVLWGEIASGLAAKFDFSTDGQSFQRSQMFDQAQRQARYYGARRSPSTITLTSSPLREDVANADEIVDP